MHFLFFISGFLVLSVVVSHSVFIVYLCILDFGKAFLFILCVRCKRKKQTVKNGKVSLKGYVETNFSINRSARKVYNYKYYSYTKQILFSQLVDVVVCCSHFFVIFFFCRYESFFHFLTGKF